MREVSFEVSGATPDGKISGGKIISKSTPKVDIFDELGIDRLGSV